MDLSALTPEHRARQLVAELELISHAPTVNLDSGARTSEHPGGKRPPGGPSTQDDRMADFELKSYLYFRRRLRRCHTTHGFEQIAAEAEATLKAWRRTPPSTNPEPGTFAWKRMIANSTEAIEDLKRKHWIGTSTIYKYRALYRDKTAA